MQGFLVNVVDVVSKLLGQCKVIDYWLLKSA